MFLEYTARQEQGTGWIEVICGSMFSGKTEELIRRLRRAQIAGQHIVIFKPGEDNRYHTQQVVSHDATSLPSKTAHSSKSILRMLGDEDVVGIDEAQFFDADLPEVCNELANKGIRVVVAGLDMDFEGQPFGPMPHLLAIAEFVTKLHAICVKTGHLAQYSHRKTADKSKLLVGGLESYEPLSRAAFLAAHKADRANHE